MDNKAIGERLIKLRGNKTREEVAEAVGVTVACIGQYERGERIPQDEIKIKLADYFKRTVQFIFYA